MSLAVKNNIPLNQYTTLHIGGVADYFVAVRSKEEVREAALLARQVNQPLFVLGGGSNVLIADGVFRRFVIKNEIPGIAYGAAQDGLVRVTVGAGEDWDGLVADTVERGLSGLENLSGIPGSVGASPVQNINAYGAQVADVVEEIEVYDPTIDTFKTLSAKDCAFGYRDSIFKRPQGAQLIVVSVTYLLTAEARVNIMYRSSSQSIKKYLQEKNITTPSVNDVRQAILHVRSNIGMLQGQFNSAGSFFKNTTVSTEDFYRIKKIVEKDFAEISTSLSPWHWLLDSGDVKIATAFLLECSPYNKNTYGNKRFKEVVGISPLHSLSIVTEDGATARDVLEFVHEIKSSVEILFGVTLATEVDYITA